MWAFVILAVIFLILWLVEKQKTKSYENLKAAKAAADAYVNQKKSEGDSCPLLSRFAPRCSRG